MPAVVVTGPLTWHTVALSDEVWVRLRNGDYARGTVVVRGRKYVTVELALDGTKVKRPYGEIFAKLEKSK